VKQWEIYDYPFAEEGPHPVVIISNSAQAGNADYKFLNGLFCRSVRPNFQPKPFHVVLDGADGLDNATAVRCDQIHMLRRDLLGARRGVVSVARRRQIWRTAMVCFQCPPA
jgi:mRNA-degrading endonuclease toxin of MazEF toxin-antitoxin module